MSAGKKKALLIISLSARPYVVAAKLAGFYVTAIDGFVDQETDALADEAFVLDFNDDGFEAAALMKIVSSLDSRLYLGCLFGGGFEVLPSVLNQIAHMMPVLGNPVHVITHVKNPQYFFDSLYALDIQYPKRIDLNDVDALASHCVIRKKVGGSGGQHITWVEPSNGRRSKIDAVNALGFYHQSYVNGQAVSVLFLAGAPIGGDESPVAIIGFNEQWTSGDEANPFQLGGIASHVVLEKAIKQNLALIVKKIVNRFKLIGLNSLDVIVAGAEIFVLEVNPRLSASLSLYLQDYLDDLQVNLLSEHINICLSINDDEIEQATLSVNASVRRLNRRNQKHSGAAKRSKALAVVYAGQDCLIDNNIDWPEWVVDLPRRAMIENNAMIAHQMQLEKGMPFCSVVADGIDSLAAKKNVNGRVNYIKSLIT